MAETTTQGTLVASAEKKEPPLATSFETRTAIVCWMMVSTFTIIVLCWWKPPAADNQLLNTLLGVYVGSGFATAIGWWMHSSKGSDDKSKAINAAMEKADA